MNGYRPSGRLSSRNVLLEHRTALWTAGSVRNAFVTPGVYAAAMGTPNSFSGAGRPYAAAAPEDLNGPQPALTVQTFGYGQVLVGGREAVWQAASAQELFFYLLSFPEGRSRSEILEDLWGLDADAASTNRFRVTLHRLRSALELPGALSELFGRYHLSPEVFEASDVRRFYAALQVAEGTLGTAERLAAYEQVLTLYQGEYLPEFQADWADRARQEHQAAFVRAYIELSALSCEASACEGAVSALSRAIKLDPFIGENHHQKLMTCLSVTRDQYVAIEHYRRFIRFLREDLGDTPMPETAALAERVKGGEHICKRLATPPDEPARRCPLGPEGQCPSRLHS